VVRSALTDVINIFEVNRKECARIALEMPRWFEWGTFKAKSGAGSEPEKNDDNPDGGNGLEWSLENSILEVNWAIVASCMLGLIDHVQVILSDLSTLPTPPQTLVYYFALITDLCKINPQTVGPAVGKSFRKLYSLLGEGLDVEVGRRFAEWFASHMSNFGFNWVWKEW